ncbi:hypothetical protein FK498_18760, partial [Elioraea sp. Yellowstone]
MTRASVSDETLTAYADGELDAEEAARVRAAVAARPPPPPRRRGGGRG